MSHKDLVSFVETCDSEPADLAIYVAYYGSASSPHWAIVTKPTDRQVRDAFLLDATYECNGIFEDWYSRERPYRTEDDQDRRSLRFLFRVGSFASDRELYAARCRALQLPAKPGARGGNSTWNCKSWVFDVVLRDWKKNRPGRIYGGGGDEVDAVERLKRGISDFVGRSWADSRKSGVTVAVPVE